MTATDAALLDQFPATNSCDVVKAKRKAERLPYTLWVTLDADVLDLVSEMAEVSRLPLHAVLTLAIKRELELHRPDLREACITAGI